MPTALQKVLREEYTEYLKQLAPLEDELKAIDAKISALKKQNAAATAGIKETKSISRPEEKSPTVQKSVRMARERLPKGQAKEIVLAVVMESRRPLRAVDIVQGLKGKLSAPTVAASLKQLMVEKAITRNERKEYLPPVVEEPFVPKIILRKAADKVAAAACSEAPASPSSRVIS